MQIIFKVLVTEVISLECHQKFWFLLAGIPRAKIIKEWLKGIMKILYSEDLFLRDRKISSIAIFYLFLTYKSSIFSYENIKQDRSLSSKNQ